MPTNIKMCKDNNYSLPAPVITFLNEQMKVENQQLRWNITSDNDDFSQLTLIWRTPGVNMSVILSAYKKTPSQRRRDSQRKHDYYVERQNNK